MSGSDETDTPLMPAGFNEINEKDFGLSNNVVSIVLFSFVILCAFLTYFRNRFPGAKGLCDNELFTCMMVLLSVAAVGLNVLHFMYEQNVGYTVLPNEGPIDGAGENVVPLSMSSVVLAYFFVKCICVCMPRYNNSRICDFISHPAIMFLVFAAAASGLALVIMRTLKEEEYNYANLEQVVPEANPL
mgnify:CR=1 FL=1